MTEPDRAHGSSLDQILLAEYSALRAEIERRGNIQWNVFALQITTAGTITGLAVTRASNLALLLLVPLSSYMFGSRYILHDFHVKLISRYFRESLSSRLHDQLGWDSWKRAAFTDGPGRRLFTVTGWNLTHPTRLAFEGVAILALVGTAVVGPRTWLTATQPPAWYVIVGLAARWLLGAVMVWLLHRAFERAASH